MNKKGDLVLVKFHPSFGFELKKYRPALVLFDPVDPRFVTVLPLSTKSKSVTNKYDVEISSESLKVKTWVLSWHPITVDTSRVVSALGKVTPSDYKKVVKILINLIK